MKKKLIAMIMLTTICVPFVACSNKAANEVEGKEGITIEEKNSKNNEDTETDSTNIENSDEQTNNIDSKEKDTVAPISNGEEVQANNSNSRIANEEKQFSSDKPSYSPNTNINTNTNTGNSSNNQNNKPNTPPTSGNVDSSYLAEVENAIFNGTNAERAKAGLPAFKRNSTANQYARSKSKDMLDNNYFDHNSPSQGMIWDIAKRDGWRYSKIGENIYTSTGMNPDGQAITTSWMNSQGHRENILNSGFAEIGIGVVYKNGKLYATQIFYTP